MKKIAQEEKYSNNDVYIYPCFLYIYSTIELSEMKMMPKTMKKIKNLQIHMSKNKRLVLQFKAVVNWKCVTKILFKTQ